jgi:hypothetical protein
MRRHRFIVDRWVWELPGGYVDDGEDGLEFVMSCQPLIGNADYPQDLYLAARGRACRRAGRRRDGSSPVAT